MGQDVFANLEADMSLLPRRTPRCMCTPILRRAHLSEAHLRKVHPFEDFPVAHGKHYYAQVTYDITCLCSIFCLLSEESQFNKLSENLS